MLVFLFAFLFLFILSLTSFIFLPNNHETSASNFQSSQQKKSTNIEKNPNEVSEKTMESSNEKSLRKMLKDHFDGIELEDSEECSAIPKSISREIRNNIINSATVDIAKLCYALRFLNIKKVSFDFSFSTEKITVDFPYEKFPYVSNKFEKEIKYLIQKLENNDYCYDKLSSIEIREIKSLKKEIEQTEKTFSIDLRSIMSNLSNFEGFAIITPSDTTSAFNNDYFLRMYLNEKICSDYIHIYNEDYIHIYNEDYKVHIIDRNTGSFVNFLQLDNDNTVCVTVFEKFSTTCNSYKDDPVIKSIFDYCSHDTQNKENNSIIEFIFEKISDERWKSYERIKKSIEEEIIFSNKETRKFGAYDHKTGSYFFKRYDNHDTECLVVPQILRTGDRLFSSLFSSYILATHSPETLFVSLKMIFSDEKKDFFHYINVVLSILQDEFTQNFIDGIENVSYGTENDDKCNNHQLEIAGKILQLFFITTRQLENYLIEKHDPAIKPILNNLSYKFTEDFNNKTVRVSNYVLIRKQIIELQKIDIKGLYNNGMLYIFELVEFCLYKSHISQTRKLKMQNKTEEKIEEMNFIGEFVERNNRPITRPSTTEMYDKDFLSIVKDDDRVHNLDPMDPQLIVFEIKYLPLHIDKYEYKDKKQAIRKVVKVLSELKEKSLQFRV